MVNLACVGVGGWGKNLVRTFQGLPNCRVLYLCDLNQERLSSIGRAYPDTRQTTSFEEVLNDKQVEGVVIATTASEHYHLAKQALLAGKHTYVEKPMTLKTAEAEELITLAKKADRKLMVGHLLLYHPAVIRLKELIQSGELGEIYYLYSQRINLGVIREDENALSSFAPHDLSVILYLLESFPTSVSARGQAYLRPDIEDVVFVNLTFSKNRMAQLQLSWLDPHKIRMITVVGSKKMVVFDDMESSEKLKVYDKGITKPFFATYGESLHLRFGDITIPHLEMTEPLTLECRHFIECIQNNLEPKTGGQQGLEVVRILEAAQLSLEKEGVPVPLTLPKKDASTLLRS